MNVGPQFDDPSVRAAYDAFSGSVKPDLLALRALAFETAAGLAGVGPLSEALKWGQPAFVTKNRTGSTFRLGQVRAGTTGDISGYAVYFLCQTSLVAGFREEYGDVLRLEGSREIRFKTGEKFPRAIVSHCFAQALTYNISV